MFHEYFPGFIAKRLPVAIGGSPGSVVRVRLTKPTGIPGDRGKSPTLIVTLDRVLWSILCLSILDND